MSEPGWAGAGERGRWGPAGRGGKGGGVREGAAEGPLPGGPGVSSVVLSPLWGGGERSGGERRGSKGRRDRVAVGPVGKWGEGWRRCSVLGCPRGSRSREGEWRYTAAGDLRGRAGLSRDFQM